jgi:hypothetical protein
LFIWSDLIGIGHMIPSTVEYKISPQSSPGDYLILTKSSLHLCHFHIPTLWQGKRASPGGLIVAGTLGCRQLADFIGF